MYTLDAARALGVEEEAGSLVRGKWADLIVLATDPRAADPDELAAIPVLRAYVSGELAFTTEA